jgi:hypothetical protein
VIEERLQALLAAIQRVYASTYFEAPRAFARRVGHRTEEEKMAVIVQRLVGSRQGDFFYPSISGVAQSYNYYPFDRMQPEEGIAAIALGLGKMVTEEEQALRFSPAHPQLLPQFSRIEDILANAQRDFYALAMGSGRPLSDLHDPVAVVRRSVAEAQAEAPLQRLCSTYIPEDHRIRDTAHLPGRKVLTFAQVLKYASFPLAAILSESLKLGQQGMGCHVELEFAVNLEVPRGAPPQFAILQLRPMAARADAAAVRIRETEKAAALCFSSNVLGNTVQENLHDILYVKPEAFDPARTPAIAAELRQFNAQLVQARCPYLLIGPGRWGSADRWLGIPVNWADISGVGAIVETFDRQLKAEPSQGSHFFHNITTLGISYLTIADNDQDFVDARQLQRLPVVGQSEFVAHLRSPRPLTLKADGKRSQAVIYRNP